MKQPSRCVSQAGTGTPCHITTPHGTESIASLHLPDHSGGTSLCADALAAQKLLRRRSTSSLGRYNRRELEADKNGLQTPGGGMLNRLAVACRSIPGSSCRALFPAPPCYAALLCACHGSRAPWPVWTASAHAVCDRSCVRLSSACRSWTDQRPLEGVVHIHFW